MKSIVRNISVVAMSVLISFIVCYSFLIKLVMRMAPLINGTGIIVFITLSFVIYVFITTIINKKFNKRDIEALALLYFIMIIGLSFFRNKYSYPKIIMNPLTIINQFSWKFTKSVILLIGNFFIYMPIGVYVRYRLKSSNLKIYLSFLLYIFIVEIVQYISRRGVFDINDIIINTLGFILGSWIYIYIYKQKVYL